MATYDLATDASISVKTGDIITCSYCGAGKSVTLPKGEYKLEVWGAQGGGDEKKKITATTWVPSLDSGITFSNGIITFSQGLTNKAASVSLGSGGDRNYNYGICFKAKSTVAGDILNVDLYPDSLPDHSFTLDTNYHEFKWVCQRIGSTLPTNLRFYIGTPSNSGVITVKDAYFVKIDNGNWEGGRGGYSSGILNLDQPTQVYFYTGGTPEDTHNTTDYVGGFNGGGKAVRRSYSGTTTYCQGGGGGTDIRIGTDSLYARVIVAGGGAGAANYDNHALYGGGLESGWGYLDSYRATQTAAGYGGSFGQAANTSNATNFKYGCGAPGGGWYGGGCSPTSASDSYALPNYTAGGSGYVYTSSTATKYPSGCLLNSSYYLTEASTLGGNVSTIPMPFSNSTYTGNFQDGFIQVTVISADSGLPGYTKIGNSIKKLTAGFCKIDGIWKRLKSIKYKIGTMIPDHFIQKLKSTRSYRITQSGWIQGDPVLKSQTNITAPGNVNNSAASATFNTSTGTWTLGATGSNSYLTIFNSGHPYYTYTSGEHVITLHEVFDYSESSDPWYKVKPYESTPSSRSCTYQLTDKWGDTDTDGLLVTELKIFLKDISSEDSATIYPTSKGSQKSGKFSCTLNQTGSHWYISNPQYSTYSWVGKTSIYTNYSTWNNAYSSSSSLPSADSKPEQTLNVKDGSGTTTTASGTYKQSTITATELSSSFSGYSSYSFDENTGIYSTSGSHVEYSMQSPSGTYDVHTVANNERTNNHLVITQGTEIYVTENIYEPEADHWIEGESEWYPKKPKIPSGYQEEEYIQSNGSQYINTSILLKRDYTVKAKYAITGGATSSNQALWCARGIGTTTDTITAFKIGSTGIRFDVGTGSDSSHQYSTGFIPTVNEPFTIEYNKQKLYINNALKYTYSVANFTTGGSVTLFASYDNGQSGSKTNYAYSKCYYYQVYDENNNLVADLVPVYRKSDHVYGLYDTVNETFLSIN